MTENLPLWSIRTPSVSRFVMPTSIQLPRSGITRQENCLRSPGSADCTKSTPGDRCNWLTTTRSAPLMMNSPPPSMIGMSPRYTSSSSDCSFTKRSQIRNGRPKVSLNWRHSSGV